MLSRLHRAGLALLACVAASAAPADEEPIRVGVLHSLSGTMAISETTLKDTVLMLIERQNAAAMDGESAGNDGTLGLDGFGTIGTGRGGGADRGEAHRRGHAVLLQGGRRHALR